MESYHSFMVSLSAIMNILNTHQDYVALVYLSVTENVTALKKSVHKSTKREILFIFFVS